MNFKNKVIEEYANAVGIEKKQMRHKNNLVRLKTCSCEQQGVVLMRRRHARLIEEVLSNKY